MTRVCFYGLDSQTHRYIGLLEGVLSECQQNLIFFLKETGGAHPYSTEIDSKKDPRFMYKVSGERDGKEKIKKKKKEKKEPRFNSMKK